MDNKKLHKDALEIGKKLIEKNPELREWVESKLPELKEDEDEKMWKLIKKYAHSNISDMALNADHITRKQLESWIERQGNKSAEWSEYDEWMLNEAINAVTVSDYAEGRKEMCIDWLKSLKPRNKWKPTEEQMDALEHFVRSIGESGYASPYDNNTKLLYSLLEQLKKLREE